MMRAVGQCCNFATTMAHSMAMTLEHRPRTEAMRTVLLPVVLAMTIVASAQITPIGTSTHSTVLTSLRTAGVKLMTAPYNDTILLYNTDLSLYRTLIIPSPDTNATTLVWAITEDLFDTDPSTIEFGVSYSYPDSMPMPSGVSIYREDGTLLLQQYPGFVNFSAGAMGWSFTPIYQTPGGPQLSIYQGSPNGPSTVYNLPGEIPCDPCSGISLGMEPGDAPAQGMNLSAFPNPVQRGTEVSIALPDGTAAQAVLLTDATGQEVLRVRIPNGATRLAIPTASLASGGYTCQLEGARGRVSAVRLIVVR